MRTSHSQGVRSALALALLVGATITTAPPAAGQAPSPVTTDFMPFADSYVSRATPDKNYGGARVLKAGGGNRTFIKFNVSGISGAVTDARLQLEITRGSGNQTIRAVGSNNWREKAIKNTNTPKLGPALGSFSAGGRSVTVDVGDWITQNGIFTFAVVSKGKTVSYASRRTSSDPKLTLTTDPSVQPTERVFAYYYLRWSDLHWHNKLGLNYPYGQAPLPLPADLGSNGCGATSKFAGNELADVPAALYTQDTPGVIEQHVRRAAEAGIGGFLVNWRGNGLADQSVDDVSYTRRLAETVRAVNEVNAQGIGFKLWVNYKASSDPVTVEQMTNDLTFFKRQFGTNTAFDHRYAVKPVVVWGGSNKYTLDFVRTISTSFRGSYLLIGDENWDSWGDGRAPYLDGDQYYWSTQNPDTNPESFGRIETLASSVRSSGPNPDGSTKLWFAPFTPGYNSELLPSHGNTCVARNDGETMRKLFDGNSRSDPDEWVLISWNEISENTHVEPLQRWGDTYLNVIQDLISQ